ncbi:anti-sigma factor domain-containing protein [Peribacillus asahii]|uniref:anti-sigma factor domain-containing protein n=1 Tax=Peribacillus asahii TaxID=228899 RepID=UPI0020791FBC|nr:anti-sigma factor domain-containing protein [Peribacillus asahii]USK71440.1 anti-sigma factor domain-containing protein [Peribacillus asahii]
MKKGIVLSVTKRHITLLTPEGEFVRRNRDNGVYEIGDEVTIIPVERTFPISSKKIAVIGTFASACLLFFSIIAVQPSTHVSAYMTIDVNPSVEIGVDDDLDVIELKGLNDEGKRVVKELGVWENKELSTVTENVVAKTKELGYLKGSAQKIVVSTTIIEKNKKVNQQLNKELQHMSQQWPVNRTKVQVIQATKEERNEAKRQGLSTGKYVKQKRESQRKKIQTNQDNQSQEKSQITNTPVQKTEEKKTAQPLQTNQETKKATNEKSSSQSVLKDNQKPVETEKSNKEKPSSSKKEHVVEEREREQQKVQRKKEKEWQKVQREKEKNWQKVQREKEKNWQKAQREKEKEQRKKQLYKPVKKEEKTHPGNAGNHKKENNNREKQRQDD